MVITLDHDHMILVDTGVFTVCHFVKKDIKRDIFADYDGIYLKICKNFFQINNLLKLISHQINYLIEFIFPAYNENRIDLMIEI